MIKALGRVRLTTETATAATLFCTLLALKGWEFVSYSPQVTEQGKPYIDFTNAGDDHYTLEKDGVIWSLVDHAKDAVVAVGRRPADVLYDATVLMMDALQTHLTALQGRITMVRQRAA